MSPSNPVRDTDRNDPRLDGWREFYGQTDSDRAVEGWDCRYLREVTSDSSHLWHIHLSETRELVESWPNKDALLSVLKGESVADWRTRTAGQPGMPRPADPVPPPPNGTWCKGELRPELRRGATGRHVTFLQKMIGASVDGDFGPKTEARVRWYQRMRGIGVDGVVGPQTWGQIDRM